MKALWLGVAALVSLWAVITLGPLASIAGLVSSSVVVVVLATVAAIALVSAMANARSVFAARDELRARPVRYLDLRDAGPPLCKPGQVNHVVMVRCNRCSALVLQPGTWFPNDWMMLQDRWYCPVCYADIKPMLDSTFAN